MRFPNQAGEPAQLGGFKSSLATKKGVQSSFLRSSLLQMKAKSVFWLPGGELAPAPLFNRDFILRSVSTLLKNGIYVSSSTLIGAVRWMTALPSLWGAVIWSPPEPKEPRRCCTTHLAPLKGAPGSELGTGSHLSKCHPKRFLSPCRNSVRRINGAFRGTFVKWKSAP